MGNRSHHRPSTPSPRRHRLQDPQLRIRLRNRAQLSRRRFLQHLSSLHSLALYNPRPSLSNHPSLLKLLLSLGRAPSRPARAPSPPYQNPHPLYRDWAILPNHSQPLRARHSSHYRRSDQLQPLVLLRRPRVSQNRKAYLRLLQRLHLRRHLRLHLSRCRVRRLRFSHPRQLCLPPPLHNRATPSSPYLIPSTPRMVPLSSLNWPNNRWGRLHPRHLLRLQNLSSLSHP